MGKFIRVIDTTSGLPVLIDADAIYVIAPSSKEPGTVIWLKYGNISVLAKETLAEVEKKMTTARVPVEHVQAKKVPVNDQAHDPVQVRPSKSSKKG